MSSMPYLHKNTYNRDTALMYGFFALLFVAGVAVCIIWVVPWAQERDAGQARNEAQRLADVRQQGFTVGPDGFNVRRVNQTGFVGSVGSCVTAIFVKKVDGKYRTYIWLNNDVRKYVTMQSLKSLPKTRDCFS